MATPITGPRELFVHELRTMLWVEVKLDEDILPELYELVHAVDLKWVVERHMHETAEHVKNVRRVLALLGEPADPVESPALLGLTKEHDVVLKQLAGEEVLDLFHADVVSRTEHHEIAAYTGLAQLAKALGVEREIVSLLRTNLEQEAHALEQVEHALAKLLAEKVG